ncbi:MAG: hypothetical protein ABI988_18695, partial [Nitrospirota bacterium]
ARRAPTMKRWSLDARSKGQSGESFGEIQNREGPRLAKDASQRDWGWVGEGECCTQSRAHHAPR